MKKQIRILKLFSVIVLLIAFPSVSHAVDCITDGGFETESTAPAWTWSWLSMSSCSTQTTPRTSSTKYAGTKSAMFLGTAAGSCTASQTAQMSQTIPLPTTAKELQFYMKIGTQFSTDTLITKGTLTVQIDSQLLGTYTSNYSTSNPNPYTSFKLVTIDLSQYSSLLDGKSHVIKFTFTVQAPGTGTYSVQYLIDNVSIPAGVIKNPPANPTNVTNYSLDVDNSSISQYEYSVVRGTASPSFIGPVDVSLQTVPIVFSLPLTGDTSPLPDDTYTLQINGFDRQTSQWVPLDNISWRVDTIPPKAIVSDPAAATTPSISASFTVSKTDAALSDVTNTDVVAYKYTLDDPKPSAATEISISISSINLNCLSKGNHTLYVIGKDTAGNWQADTDATTKTWTVAPTPTATLSGTPQSTTQNTTASITVGGDGVTAYMYKLDSEVYSAEIPAATLITLSSLSPGQHTLSVVGKDCAGNWQDQASPTSAAWTIEVVPITISGQPTDTTTSSSAAISVSGTGIIAYKYSIDDPTPSNSTEILISASPTLTLTCLSNGVHTLYIIGKDSSNSWQTDTNATKSTWTVAAAAPANAVISAPPTATQSSASFTVSDANGVIKTYKYKLDNGTYSADIPIATPISLSGLTSGSHTLYVIGKDCAGNSQAAETTAAWTTKLFSIGITGQPTGQTTSSSAAITVNGTDLIAYKYSIDNPTPSTGAEILFSTSQTINLTCLSNGDHTLYIIGKDGTNTWQTDANAIKATWTVAVAAPANAVLSAPPVSPTNQSSATFTVSDANAVIKTYKYKLDNGTYSADIPISTPISLSGLGSSDHTLYVIGKDCAGNAQTAETTATWTVVILKGDINNDKSIDLKDAILGLQILTSIQGTVELGADVNIDKKLGLEDVIYILQMISKLRS